MTRLRTQTREVRAWPRSAIPLMGSLMSTTNRHWTRSPRLDSNVSSLPVTDMASRKHWWRARSPPANVAGKTTGLPMRRTLGAGTPSSGCAATGFPIESFKGLSNFGRKPIQVGVDSHQQGPVCLHRLGECPGDTHHRIDAVLEIQHQGSRADQRDGLVSDLRAWVALDQCEQRFCESFVCQNVGKTPTRRQLSVAYKNEYVGRKPPS